MSAKQTFERFDKNKDGKLSSDEFRELALSFSNSFPREEIDKLFKDADMDGDGEVNVDEFTTWVESLCKEAFEFCDVDGDEKITLSELCAIINGLGKECTEKRCATLAGIVDADGDRYLNFDEFMAVVFGLFDDLKED